MQRRGAHEKYYEQQHFSVTEFDNAGMWLTSQVSAHCEKVLLLEFSEQGIFST